ncbi:Protein of unknown function [Alteribacillus persepolensis]|uniref:DUF2624 domain-containing protein n=1 Tax=Alteribacillus persepolensis TaxID=568899 RepID=A0A1G8CSU0_9BACI|nr:DUF2624 family protein [Alteribacillus persepolensis]SDH48617.1 Protein of unknown function [Alteribacillus persepolensis]
MNHFKEQWIKYKLSELHPNDLIHYGKLYGITVSYEEAAKLLELVQTSSWSIDDKQSLHNLLEKAEKIVAPQTYALMQELFNHFIGDL